MSPESASDPLASAEEAVRATLDAIARDPWRDLHVPDGFRIEALLGERRASVSPSGATHISVSAELCLPVVFVARDGRATTANRENLDTLRVWIEEECVPAPGRVRLLAWDVTPTEDPLPKRRPTDPEEEWTVAAVFRLP